MVRILREIITKLKLTYIIIIIFITTGCTSAVEESDLYLTKEDIYATNHYLTKVTEITREDFVNVYARNNNITFEEADALISEQTYKSLLELPESENIEEYQKNIKWRQRYWDFNLPENTDFKARLIIFYELWESESFKQINSAITGSELVEGPYNATWIQLNSDARAVNNNLTSGNFPTQRLSIMASGYFEITTLYPLDTGFTIPGFSFSGNFEEMGHFISNSFLMQYQYNINSNY